MLLCVTVIIVTRPLFSVSVIGHSKEAKVRRLGYKFLPYIDLN
jgi:hypothetical protein